MSAIRWDFERAVLAVMLGLIVLGCGFVVWQDGVVDDLRRRLPTAERQLAQVGELAEEVLVLKDEIASDEVVSGRQGAYEYIEAQEVASRIGKKFNIQTPTSDARPSAGYEDTRYLLTPASGGIDFNRRMIASFLLFIEAKTTRMKITRIRLDLSRRKGATLDDWKPQITITDRHPYQEG